MKNKQNIAGAILLCITILAILFSPKLNRIFQSSKSYGIEVNEDAYNFHLKKIPNGDLQLNDLQNNIVLLYFGYINCPTLCPLRMSKLLEVSRRTDRKDLRFVYITIDPKQDSVERLKSFSEQIGNKFLVLYSDPETIKKTAQEYKVFYEKEGDQWNHTDKAFLIDKAGKIVRIYLPSHSDASKIEEELKLF